MSTVTTLPSLSDAKLLSWSCSATRELDIEVRLWDERVIRIVITDVVAVCFTGAWVAGVRLLPPGTDDPCGLFSALRRDGAGTTELRAMVLDGVDGVVAAVVFDTGGTICTRS